jgi:hypothetical protein
MSFEMPDTEPIGPADSTPPRGDQENTADPNVTGGRDKWREKWVPSPKWAVALVVGLGGIATAMIEADDEWSSTIQIMVVTLVVARLSAYIAPNKSKSPA